MRNLKALGEKIDLFTNDRDHSAELRGVISRRTGWGRVRLAVFGHARSPGFRRVGWSSRRANLDFAPKAPNPATCSLRADFLASVRKPNARHQLINNVEVGRYAGDPRKRRRSRRAPGRFFKGLEGQYRAKRPKLSAKPLSLPVSRSAHYRQANTRTWRTRSIRNQQGAGGYD